MWVLGGLQNLHRTPPPHRARSQNASLRAPRGSSCLAGSTKSNPGPPKVCRVLVFRVPLKAFGSISSTLEEWPLGLCLKLCDIYQVL